MAGKRKGNEDDRHLWPEMLRVIKQVKPTWVVGENVYGLVNWSGGLVFHEIISDLENAGYEVQPYLIPAVGVDAPHRRDRLWIVAHRNDLRGEKEYELQQSELCKQFGEEGATSDSADNGNRIGLRTDGNGQEKTQDQRGKSRFEFREDGKNDVANTNGGKRRKGGMHETKPEQAERHIGSCDARDYKRTTWDNFPTQPPVCSRNDGLSIGLVGITVSKHRNESIKAYGNAIVPQVVYQIFKSINEYNEIPD